MLCPRAQTKDWADEKKAMKSSGSPRSASQNTAVPATLAAMTAVRAASSSLSSARSSSTRAEWTAPWIAPNRRRVSRTAAAMAAGSVTSADR
ncbi:hypothetical protein ABAZ39_27250 (plasmid) [Azospirillum argentinense]|uniref:Uncharacterized protein n=1 Tax=Azospirillum argentinense TaxID=2970906 RepID=A0A060DWT5_9PROT|nr:hypothetical protein [Azospirillum argentinense]AIB15568.1 hypothetical protein ABAZ39_27250 [Azospirillum argentinense]EZQ03736.1 hypothetical protein ABAZ39_28930 [Azospirillum argentinense]